MRLFHRTSKNQDVTSKQEIENKEMNLEDKYDCQFKIVDDTAQKKFLEPLVNRREHIPESYEEYLGSLNHVDDLDEVPKSEEWKKMTESEKYKYLNDDLDSYWQEYNIFNNLNTLYYKLFNKHSKVSDQSDKFEITSDDKSQLTKYFIISYCTTIQAMILAIFLHGLERILSNIICNCEC